MKFLSVLCSLFLLTLAVKSQDIHLTQYYTSNISLNPAYTGSYSGDVRLVCNSRSQWGQISSINTNMVSVEKKILRFPDEIGVGMLFANDQISALHIFTNKIILSGSYLKEYKKNVFRAGIQAGLIFKSININDQTFPDQWNYPLGIYDPSLPTRENSINDSRFFPNFSLGAGWTRRFGVYKVAAGYALNNLTHPKDGFVTSMSEKMPFRHAFNTSLTYPLGPKTNIIPHILFMKMARATDFIGGSNLTYLLKPETSILFGLGYRGSDLNSDAILGTAGIGYKRFQFGFSMDFTVSKLNLNARNKSAWEIMLTYTTPGRTPGKITLPCDRY